VIEEFDLHLAVEDAIQDHQRPKLDRYPTHLFVNVYAVAVERDLDKHGFPHGTRAASRVSAFVVADDRASQLLLLVATTPSAADHRFCTR
jgi:hypothetical protein